MPTAEEKAELKAAAQQRAEAQQAAGEGKDEAIKDFREQAAEDQKGGAAVQPMPVTEAAGDAVEEWGPYDDYRVVPTPTGENGVPYGRVLFFRDVETFDSRADRMVRRHEPTYRQATKAEMAPILARKKKRHAARDAAKTGVVG